MAEILGCGKVAAGSRLEERLGKRQTDGDDRGAGKVQVKARMQHPRQGDVARAEYERIGKRADRKHERRRSGKSDRQRDQQWGSVRANGKTAANRQEGRRGRGITHEFADEYDEQRRAGDEHDDRQAVQEGKAVTNP